MSLKQRVYSVLIVSSSDVFAHSLTSMLDGPAYSPVCTVKSISAAGRMLAERSFDFILVSSPLPDDTGINFAIDISTSRNSIVLMMIRSELHDEIFNKVAEHGVFTLPKPISMRTMSTALDWMAVIRERLKKSEAKTLSIEEKMQEIRLVNRAKWLLISQLKMDEPQAHRYIEKQAMDRCVTKGEIAQMLIRTYSS